MGLLVFLLQEANFIRPRAKKQVFNRQTIGSIYWLVMRLGIYIKMNWQPQVLAVFLNSFGGVMVKDFIVI